MALQLGALRDALLAAHVSPEQAAAAAEEVAGYENRLTQLTTLVQVALGLLLVLIGSQFALWIEIGKVNGVVTRIDAQNTRIETQVLQLNHTPNEEKR